MAKRTANLYVRIEPSLKRAAESILEELGISTSSAVNMFYRQIVIQNGLPFEPKLAPKKPIAMAALSKDELDVEIEKGYSDIAAGRTTPAEQAFAEINQLFDQ